MRLTSLTGFMLTITVAALACTAPAAPPTSAPAPTTAPAPATARPAATSAPASIASPAAQPSAAPAVASASPSAVAAERVDGTIQTVTGSQLTLTSGRSFSLPAGVRISRTEDISASDLKQGDYVAVTAERQPDNTLLASIVNVFPPSLGQVAPGQRPLPQGDLMTNASIDQIQGNMFTVTFPGGGARVQLAPDAHITRTLDAALSDLTPGTNITAQVVDDAARAVTINASPSAATTIQVRTDPKLGPILTDAQGRTLYKFDHDTSGASSCSGGCAATWPALSASGTLSAPADAPGTLTAINREGGQQVAYNGIPLYTYAADTQPGDTKGDGVGGIWHVVHPTDTTP